jgi:hypothetical protein
MPKFGGYDPIGVSRGVAVAGNPNVWLISGERLYLFYDRARLEKFAGDADRLSAEAERKWPDVKRAQPLSRTALEESPQARKAGIKRSWLP